MKKIPILLALAAGASICHAGETQLFNGKDLTGWKGQPEFWSVKDGAITGQTTRENPVKENTFLIWDGEAGDFELRFKYKIVDADGKGEGFGNSGVQYRSRIVKPEYSVIAGYQADFEVGKTYSGILYEEKGRGILAQRGQKVIIHEGDTPDKPKIEITGNVGKSDEIQTAIHSAAWNDYVVIAKGNHLQHFINGKQTVDVTDETAIGAKAGKLALQLHAGNPMTVQFKDIVLVLADSATADAPPPARPANWAQPVKLDGLPNLHQVGKTLYRSAQPTETGAKSINSLGIRTVVNLRAFHSDKDELKGMDAKQVHIRMKTWHAEHEDMIKFLKIATDPAQGPVLVHCQHGADRTGTACAVYRVVVQGWTKEEAIREMTEGGYGFHEVWKNLPDWIKDIDVEAMRKEVGLTGPLP